MINCLKFFIAYSCNTSISNTIARSIVMIYVCVHVRDLRVESREHVDLVLSNPMLHWCQKWDIDLQSEVTFSDKL